jgi:hypothetical protein
MLTADDSYSAEIAYIGKDYCAKMKSRRQTSSLRLKILTRKVMEESCHLIVVIWKNKYRNQHRKPCQPHTQPYFGGFWMYSGDLDTLIHFSDSVR